MASIAFYDISVGTFTKALKVLHRILIKASLHPDAASFLDARLAPDMYTLTKQVQIAAAFSAMLAETLTGRKLVTWNELGNNFGGEDETWADVIGRVEKTLELLKEVDPEEANAKAASRLTQKMRVSATDSVDVPVGDCVMVNGLPNVFFHVYIAYAILRSRGVDLGKGDVLAPFMSEYIANEGQTA